MLPKTKKAEVDLDLPGRLGRAVITTLVSDGSTYWRAAISDPTVTGPKVHRTLQGHLKAESHAKARRAASDVAQTWALQNLGATTERYVEPVHRTDWDKKGLTPAERELLLALGEYRKRYLKNPKISPDPHWESLPQPLTSAGKLQILQNLQRRGAIRFTSTGNVLLRLPGHEIEALKPTKKKSTKKRTKKKAAKKRTKTKAAKKRTKTKAAKKRTKKKATKKTLGMAEQMKLAQKALK